jgi:hypothetical protein
MVSLRPGAVKGHVSALFPGTVHTPVASERSRADRLESAAQLATLRQFASGTASLFY